MRKLLFVLMLLGCAIVATTTQADTLYWTNVNSSGTFTNSSSWNPASVPTAADTLILTNVSIGGVYSQTLSNDNTALTAVNNLWVFTGSSGSSAFTNIYKRGSSATSGKLSVYNEMLLGWRDGANSVWSSASGSGSLFITNANKTATLWVGVTNNNGNAVIGWANSGLTVDNFYTTNNAALATGLSGTLTVNTSSRITSSTGGNLGTFILGANSTNVWSLGNATLTLQSLSMKNQSQFDLKTTSAAATAVQITGPGDVMTLTNATFNLDAVNLQQSSGGLTTLLSNSAWRVSGSTLTNGGVVVVANIGGGATNSLTLQYQTNNFLRVTDSSTLLTKDVVVASLNAATTSNSIAAANYLLVDNSTWTNSGNLSIGRYARASTVNGSAGTFVSNNYVQVQNNAKVYIGGNVTIGEITAAGTPTGIGGNYFQIDGGTGTVVGTVDARYGALKVNGGQLTLGSLFATNSAASVSFTGGRLVAQNITVNNGSALTVGDSAGATAILQLLNGSNTKVANGLTLASDGVLEIGSSPGTANVEGALTLNPGSKWTIDWTTLTSGDTLNVTGAVVLSGATLEVNLGGSFAVGSIWTNLVAFGGTITTNGLTLTAIGTPLSEGALAFKLNNDATVGYLEVIPEPSALTLVGLGLGLAMMMVRRRR